MGDPRAKYGCRNRVAVERGAATATIASLIGAGIGYAGARSLGQDPALGALVGLFVVGGGTTVLQYSNYLLEKANNDRLLAMDLLGGAVAEDTTAHRQAFQAINKNINNSIGALDNIDRREKTRTGRLTDSATELRQLHVAIKHNAQGSDVYVKAAQYYGETSDAVSERRSDPPFLTKRRDVGEKISILGREAVEQKRINLAALEYLERRGIW